MKNHANPVRTALALTLMCGAVIHPSPPAKAQESALGTAGSTNQTIQILERAIERKGGRELIKRFLLRKEVSTGEGMNGGKRFKTSTTTYLESPDKMRIDQAGSAGGKGFGPSTFYIMGDQTISIVKPGLGWIPKKITPESEQRLRRGMYLAECEALLPLLDPSFKLETTAVPSDLDAQRIASIGVTKSGKPDVVLSFDRSTGDEVGLDYDVQGRGGRLIHVRSRNTEFKEFSGFRVAGKSHYQEGSEVDEVSTLQLVEPLGFFPGPGLDARDVGSLRRRSPNTLEKIEQNEAVESRKEANSSEGQEATSSAPLTIDDLIALSESGVKREAILDELRKSHSKFTAEELGMSRESKPPMDSAVIDYIKANPK